MTNIIVNNLYRQSFPRLHNKQYISIETQSEEKGLSKQDIEEVKKELSEENEIDFNPDNISINYQASSLSPVTTDITNKGWKGDSTAIFHSDDTITKQTVYMALFGNPTTKEINGIGVLGAGTDATGLLFPKSITDENITYYSLNYFRDVAVSISNQNCDFIVIQNSKNICAFSANFNMNSYGCFIYNIVNSYAQKILKLMYDSADNLIINSSRFANVDNGSQSSDDVMNQIKNNSYKISWIEKQIDNFSYNIPVAIDIYWSVKTINKTDYSTYYVNTFNRLKVAKDAEAVPISTFYSDSSLKSGIYAGFVTKDPSVNQTNPYSFPIGIILFRRLPTSVTGTTNVYPRNLTEYIYPVFTLSTVPLTSDPFCGEVNVLVRLTDGTVIRSGFTKHLSTNEERNYVYIKIADVNNPTVFLDNLMLNMCEREVALSGMTFTYENTKYCDTIYISQKNKGEIPS